MSSVQTTVVQDILAARERANQIGNGARDLTWSENDWIAFILAYLGRASVGVYRNEKEHQDYRDNLVKAGGLIISAIVAYDRVKGYDAVAKPETVGVLVTE